MQKLRLGVFKYSCCAGCEFQLLYFQHHVIRMFENLEVLFLKMAQSGGREEGPFDLALIEGAVTQAEQADQLKRVRKRSKWLLPIGSCATNGGVPAIKNHTPELELEERVYREVGTLHSMKAQAVDAFVRVDGYIRGCPAGERDLMEAVFSFLIGKTPGFSNYPVCVECKTGGHLCVLVARQQPCMGPATNAGCGALCPSYGRACYGCWGPTEDAHAPALARRFEKMGFTPEEIFCRFTQYASAKAGFRRGAELYGQTD